MPATDEHIELSGSPLDESNFHKLKTSLKNSKGISYTDYKKTLKPDFKKVWIDIISGWAALIIVLLTAYWLFKQAGMLFSVCITICAAVLLGYIIAYLINFFHEAAHFNIAPGKKMNDTLANFFIGILIAQGIKNYRIVHWQHHVALGTTSDTENSYFESLNLHFFVTSLTGISALKFFFTRNEYVSGQHKIPANILKLEKYTILVLSLVFHLTLLITLYFLQAYWMMATWLIAVAGFYPFFNRIRQLMEHRSENANQQTDYHIVAHGRTNRIFGNSIIDKTLGSAGFNKHMLHHLEPSISYTLLDELELFLTDTAIGEILKKQQTTYLRIFKKLLNR